MGWSFSLGFGDMLRNPRRKNLTILRNISQGLGLRPIHCIPQTLEKKENIMSQIISYSYISRKPMIRVGARYCTLFLLRWYSYDIIKVNKNVAKRNP